MNKNYLLLVLAVSFALHTSAEQKEVKPSLELKSEPPSAMNKEDAKKYERENYFGKAVRNDKGELTYVEESDIQKHSRANYVMVHVKNIKNTKGRIRVIAWDKPDNYGQEGRIPFRAASFVASEHSNGTMMFKIALDKVGASYSFFAHHDENDDGVVNRIFGIPTEPYVFTNAKTQGKGEGLKRVGLSPPPYERTLVPFTSVGQVVELNF